VNKYFSSEDFYEKSGWRTANQRHAEIDWAETVGSLKEIHHAKTMRALQVSGQANVNSNPPTDETRNAMKRLFAVGKDKTRATLFTYVRTLFFMAAALFFNIHGSLDGFNGDLVVIYGDANEHARSSWWVNQHNMRYAKSCNGHYAVCEIRNGEYAFMRNWFGRVCVMPNQFLPARTPNACRHP